MVGAAGTPDQVAFHPGLLPAFEPDRAVMGRDAQKRNAQQVYATCAQFADATLGFLRETVSVAAGRAATFRLRHHPALATPAAPRRPPEVLEAPGRLAGTPALRRSRLKLGLDLGDSLAMEIASST